MTRWRAVSVALWSVFLLLGAAGYASAQGVVVAARAGHCQIRISAKPSGEARLIVQRGNETIFSDGVRAADLPKTINVGTPLGANANLRVGLGGPAAPVTIADADGSADGCKPLEEKSDAFSATFYFGTSVDTFAADDLKRYLNPDESGDPRFHWTVGVDFEYRAFQWGHQSFWILGETLHSAKSTDLDCGDNTELEKCKDLLLAGLPKPTPERYLAILRNATSVEANVAGRWHVRELTSDADSTGALYLQGKLGYVTVSNSDADAALFYTLSGGFLLTGGPFEGSYLDIGFGRSDVYRRFPNRRVKFDGLLSFDVPKSPFRPYFQMTVDADFRDGPDSIQSYFGLDFDPRVLFKW